MITDKFIPTWYNITIESNPRSFVKSLYQIRNEELADNLHRMKKFEKANKKLSYKILNTKIDQENKGNYESFKDARFKNFRFKLMINELPVIEKLKIRSKQLYDKDLKCIRCNRKSETLHHLWECDIERNKIIEFERIMKEWIHDRIHNMKIFKEVDNLLDNLYKYTRFTVTLKDINTKENTEIFINSSKRNLKNGDTSC